LATKKWEEEHVVIGISIYWCVEARKRTAELGISTYFADLRCLGRDSQQTAPGISTIFCRFAPFG